MDEYFDSTCLHLEDSSVEVIDGEECVKITDLVAKGSFVFVGYDEIPDLIHFLLSVHTNRP